jgi:predicted transcriptional regulator
MGYKMITGEAPGEVQRLLTITIPGKPTSSKQKYRLTQKGRDFIAKLAKVVGTDVK